MSSSVRGDPYFITQSSFSVNESMHETGPSRDDTDVERSDGEKNEDRAIGLRGRLKHFTWAWFTSTMSTGGLAIAFAETPHRFDGLYTIGVILFIFNLVLFLLLCSLMITRLIIEPQRFLNSFVHPPESFFFGSFWLSIAVIIGSIQLYGVTMGPERTWLISAVRVLYWIYATVSLVNATQQYWIFIHRTPARPVLMSPAWFLPGYSAMLTGTVASMIAGSQPPESKIAIIVSGCAYQGFGWLISSVLIVLYVINLMEFGLPSPDRRPGMFIPVGSAAYTIVALIGQARAIPRDYGYFASHPTAADTLQTMALFIGIFLWIFAFWLFIMAVLACSIAGKEMGFTLSWWAFVFPNVGFMVATMEIGRELESQGILWVASAMTACLVVVYLFTAAACVRAVLVKRILWPGRDEDKDM